MSGLQGYGFRLRIHLATFTRVCFVKNPFLIVVLENKLRLMYIFYIVFFYFVLFIVFKPDAHTRLYI